MLLFQLGGPKELVKPSKWMGKLETRGKPGEAGESAAAGCLQLIGGAACNVCNVNFASLF